MSSENVLDISWNPTANGVKLVQVRSTRPESELESICSLSAASNGSPLASTWPLGLLAGRTSKGPSQVTPQSVERWTPIVCTAVAPNFASTIDE